MKKIIFLVSALFLFISVSPVFATTIFSPVIEMEVDAGATQAGVIKVYNETDQDLVLTASLETFAAGDETGQAVYQAPGQPADYLQWFKLAQTELILKPKQVAIVPFTVSVPPAALPGGYYAVIFWQSPAGSVADTPAVGVLSKVGALVLLKVKGLVTETGELAEFTIQPSKKYFFALPLTFITRFANTGNIHQKPSGTITLKNWLGQRTVEVNPTQRNILPQSIRRFDTVWGAVQSPNSLVRFWQELIFELKNLTFGKYTADLTLNYGQDNPSVVSRQIEFWLIPYNLVVALFAAWFILLVLFKVNKKVKKMKNREKQNPQ